MFPTGRGGQAGWRAGQTLEGSFSAVWTATIASKGAFCCILERADKESCKTNKRGKTTFLSAQTKSPVEKRKAKRENNMRKYARIGAAASSKLRPVTLLQGAPHSPRGACYAGWKKAARRLYAAMLLHFLLANSTRLH